MRMAGVIGAAGLCLVAGAAPASNGFTPIQCLFSTDCSGAEDCAPRPFSVEIAPADHAGRLWFTYEGRVLAVNDVTPADTPLMIFHAPGFEENTMLTVFPTGEAIHVRQDYRTGQGPRQQTAFGHCEVL